MLYKNIHNILFVEKDYEKLGISKSIPEEEALTYFYLRKSKNKQFEGIAYIITCCNIGDFKNLAKYILSVSLEGEEILKILVYVLSNIDIYKGKFLYEILKFKKLYEIKLKQLLFEVSLYDKIDKMDVLYLFKTLLLGKI